MASSCPESSIRFVDSQLIPSIVYERMNSTPIVTAASSRAATPSILGITPGTHQDNKHKYSRILSTPTPLCTTELPLPQKPTVRLSSNLHRGVNICCNAPTKGVGVRVERWTPQCAALSCERTNNRNAQCDGFMDYSGRGESFETHQPDLFSGVMVIRSNTLATISRQTEASYQHESSSRNACLNRHHRRCVSEPFASGLRAFSPKPDNRLAQQDAAISAETEILKQSQLMAYKHQKKRDFRYALKCRLLESAYCQKEAFKKVLENTNAEAIEKHAGYLGHSRIEKRQELKQMQNNLPRTLSNESLAIKDLPVTRSYTVYPQEKFHFHQQHFHSKDLDRFSDILPKSRNDKDLEKELRLGYRTGHLDEIKRKHFGKVYEATRKHYMDLERKKCLDALQIKQAKQKTAGDKCKKTPTSQERDPTKDLKQLEGSSNKKINSTKQAGFMRSKTAKSTIQGPSSTKQYIPERYTK
ncbi:hypothetical protein BATDEDRAFT_22823 [Batrachochytrium dendrobatidis JAM81]|uniref:Uncharacterized protein n=2 Tax=Batrachochytrium dendrobatidis TaxID=109871 RepID=F4NVW2_BATDJ|nr:uncharacterized protein BATDEDRAFT_22823 [Batrachochytrium dendrobatidis JAM81]EGF82723.1 hypothetical protein BATDEDRAFT_22823 [Batrachochytrium dendrobatidis JAM81]OAJ39790.1 hypothetical protein BDEG_23613 [Batrachochytrium dendrobatidis JEL423]|eukprot:XP_006676639.1 hypothetical protein BATDEDRAFT_22823 [Batrachochytrium dendrobatidis JAM81]